MYRCNNSLGVFLPTAGGHTQSLWTSLTTKSLISTQHKQSNTVHAQNSLAVDLSSEQLTVMSYHENNWQLTTTAISHAYGSDPALLHSVTQKKIDTIDVLTGNRLIHYHGRNDHDQLAYSYDGLSHNVYRVNLEHGLHGRVHKARQKITYTLRNGKFTVAVTQLDNLNSNGIPYTVTTESSLSQSRKWDNMPEHGETESSPAQLTLTNDLGERYQSIIFPRSNGEFKSKQTTLFDANGRVFSRTVDNALDPSLKPNAELQSITNNKIIDDVANTMTTQKIAAFYTIDNSTGKRILVGKLITMGSSR